MKYFAYTYELKARTGGVEKTITLYTVKRNILTQVVTISESYIDEFSLVMKTLETYKLLPKKAFERGPSGGFKYKQAWLLRDAGIANVQRI